jgi:hypothetical protein
MTDRLAIAMDASKFRITADLPRCVGPQQLGRSRGTHRLENGDRFGMVPGIAPRPLAGSANAERHRHPHQYVREQIGLG